MNSDLKLAHMIKTWGCSYIKTSPGQMCDRATMLPKSPWARMMAWKANKSAKVVWPHWKLYSGLMFHFERYIDRLENVQGMTNICRILENVCPEEKILQKPGLFRWSVEEKIRGMLITDFGRQCSIV